MSVSTKETPTVSGVPGIARSAPTSQSRYLPVGATEVPFGPRPGLPFDQPTWAFSVTGVLGTAALRRSEEHTSELQSLMRISYAVFCLKKKKQTKPIKYITPNLKQQHSYSNTKRKHVR